MSGSAELISKLTDAADSYQGLIDGASAGSLAKRPDEKNWSPLEIICHMRDVEENFLVRIKTMLVVDELKFQPADVNRWAEDRQYRRNDAGEALSSFRRFREEMLAFLKTLKPEDWDRSGIHYKRGRMSVTDTVNLMVNHDNAHLEQLKQALDVQ
jgi:hypothetical protein